MATEPTGGASLGPRDLGGSQASVVSGLPPEKQEPACGLLWSQPSSAGLPRLLLSPRLQPTPLTPADTEFLSILVWRLYVNISLVPPVMLAPRPGMPPMHLLSDSQGKGRLKLTWDRVSVARVHSWNRV